MAVRFRPNFWELFLAILAGSIVGIFLRRILEKDQSELSASIFLKGFLLAAIAEVVAVAIMSGDSRLKIWGIDLDPQQFIPALLLAIYVAGGRSVWKWISDLIKKGGGDSGANSGGAGAGIEGAAHVGGGNGA